MKLTWLGHACFLLEQEEYRIVVDPYTDVPGYPPLQVQAHEILCSHHHFDHDFTQAVTLLPRRESPFTVRRVETCHDDQGGALRGANTIHILTAGGITVAHLGDLGHQLTARQLADIGPVNGVLVPVGGVYTIDAAGARAACEAVGASWAVPMHYHHAPCGLPNVGGVEPFLALWPAEKVHALPGRVISVTAETDGILLPRFQKEGYTA